MVVSLIAFVIILSFDVTQLKTIKNKVIFADIAIDIAIFITVCDVVLMTIANIALIVLLKRYKRVVLGANGAYSFRKEFSGLAIVQFFFGGSFLFALFMN